jgi:hypothetical protein
MMNLIRGPLTITLLIVLFIAGMSFSADTTYTEGQISFALDYAMSGLTKEAKETLVPLLHDDRDTNFNSKVRYFIGSICFFLEEDTTCSEYYWRRILDDEPNGPEADAVRGFLRNREFLASQAAMATEEDWRFTDDLRTARKFWSYKTPDYKINPEDLLDEDLAMDYYDMLLARYQNPRKRAILLFDKFFTLAGFNNDGYGFLKYKGAKYPQEIRKKQYYWAACNSISDSLKDILGANDYYVHSQFLLGVLSSGTKFLSSAIKLNDESAKYFESVMKSTEGDDTSLFRIFAAVWLKKNSAGRRDR